MRQISFAPVPCRATRRTGSSAHQLRHSQSAAIFPHDLVHMPEVEKIQARRKVTHAGNAGDPVAGGALQHIAFNVEGTDQLLRIRDRIRDRGVQVHGPVDHGFCQSIYLAGPEGIQLEFSTSERAIDPNAWIDPEVVSLCGIDDAELARYKSPAPMPERSNRVEQPAFDSDKPHQIFDPPMDEWIKRVSDEEFAETMSHPNPPVSDT